MANDIISINNNKEQILEFTLSIEGLDTKDMSTRLVIHANNMELGFQAIKKDGDTWTVKLPALPILERTAYPYHLEIIADGYHFEPMRGTINVVGSHEVYVTAPRNTRIESPISEEKKAIIKKQPKVAPPVYRSEPTKQREKSIEQLARELMKVKAPTPKKLVPLLTKVEPVKENILPIISVVPEPVKIEPEVISPKPEIVTPVILVKLEPVIAPKSETPVILVKENLLPVMPKPEPKSKKIVQEKVEPVKVANSAIPVKENLLPVMPKPEPKPKKVIKAKVQKIQVVTSAIPVKENLLPIIVKSEPKTLLAKDQVVLDILKDSGHKSKKSRFSIKN